MPLKPAWRVDDCTCSIVHLIATDANSLTPAEEATRNDCTARKAPAKKAAAKKAPAKKAAAKAAPAKKAVKAAVRGRRDEGARKKAVKAAVQKGRQDGTGKEDCCEDRSGHAHGRGQTAPVKKGSSQEGSRPQGGRQKAPAKRASR